MAETSISLLAPMRKGTAASPLPIRPIRAPLLAEFSGYMRIRSFHPRVRPSGGADLPSARARLPVAVKLRWSAGRDLDAGVVPISAIDLEGVGALARLELRCIRRRGLNHLDRRMGGGGRCRRLRQHRGAENQQAADDRDFLFHAHKTFEEGKEMTGQKRRAPAS